MTTLFWLADSPWPLDPDAPPSLALFAALLLAIIIFGCAIMVVSIRRSWKVDFHRTARTLKAGHVRGELARLRGLYSQGDRSFNLLVSLLGATLYDGYTTEASALADELEAAYERQYGHLRETPERKLMHDMVYMGHFSAWLNQGEFIRAAEYLGPRAQECRLPHFAALFAALAYYYGHDTERAAGIIRDWFPNRLAWWHRSYWQISAHYRFMLAYLQHTLCGQDQRDTLRRQRAQMAYWEGEQGRNTNNPYGARLRDILADIREVMQ